MTDDSQHSAESAAPLPQPRRRWIKTVALSLALLVSGAVMGSGATLIVIKRGMDNARNQPGWMSDRMLARMQRNLDLTDDQVEQIRQIFKENRRRVQTFRQRQHEQARTFMDRLHDDVAAVLTPEQQKKWDEWHAKARERAFRHRPPPPDGPRPRRDDRDRPPPPPGL